MSPGARTLTVLGRFPRHLDADDPGKLFSDVVDGLGHELDVKTVQLGGVRRAHALGDANQEADVLLLAGLHDLVASDFEILRVRLEAVRSTGQVISYTAELDLLRSTIRSLIALHRAGNGTVSSLLGAAAAYLALGIDSVADTDEDFWHIATCHDVLRPAPDPDLLALEENPLREQDAQPIDRRHGDRFQILRSGFGTVPATVRVVGVGTRTVAPMVVNLDSGAGLVFTGSVPDGQELRFESDGRVTLAGASVARLSYSFTGGVFADATKADSTRDFVFGGDSVTDQVATFAVTAPVVDAFDPATVFPHVDGLIGTTTLAVGETRWAFFVRAATYGEAAATKAEELAVPTFNAGVFDDSVFEPDTRPGTPYSGQVGFSWQEHEPFAAILWLPRRFSALDAAGEVPISERVRLALDRHRAAGIHVYVQYADDRWTTPGGVIRDVGSSEPVGTLIVGTGLWSSTT